MSPTGTFRAFDVEMVRQILSGIVERIQLVRRSELSSAKYRASSSASARARRTEMMRIASWR